MVMQTGTILDAINNEPFSKNDILIAIQKTVNPVAGPSQLKYCLATMLEKELIERTGRNEYVRAGVSKKKEYKNQYSEEALKVIRFMEKKYPLLEYRVWELSWLNEFVNHLIGSNRIMLEVEKEACEFIYYDIAEVTNQRVLVRPTDKEMMLYSDTNTIVIDRLVSESPKGKERFNVPLEKILIDLISNKKISLSKKDLYSAVEIMQRKYKIDKSKIMRYARRRGKEEEVRVLLKETSL